MQPGRAERGSRGDERRRRWDDHRVQRRRELIEAAVRVIQRRGPAVTMDDIAAEAGVARPVRYRVVRDRGALREVGLDSGGAEPWAHALVGMAHEAGDWWIEHRTMTRDDLTRYLAALAWGGLADLYRKAGVYVEEKLTTPYVVQDSSGAQA